MAKLVSNIYGEALFDVAVTDGIVQMLKEEVEAVLTIFAENAEYVGLLEHPKLSLEEKKKLIEEAFSDKICSQLLGFFITVVEKGRFGEITGILSYFQSRVREYEKVGKAIVTTAMPLSLEEKDEVEKRLLETTDYTSFLMTYLVDASLIGGMTIRIGDRVVDSSIRTKLNNMAKQLSKLQLQGE